MAAVNEFALAEGIIKEFGISSEKDLPVDIDRILKSKGFIVNEENLPEGLCAVLDVRDRTKPVLLLEKTLQEKDKRFAKAWELGQFLLDVRFDGIRTDKGGTVFSTMQPLIINEADRINLKARNFAASLLMPKNLFEAEVTKQSVTQNKSAPTDDDIIKALSAMTGVFAVGLGIVLLASAFSNGKDKK